MARVECPAELVEMTQVKRIDDPNTFEIEEANRPGDYQNGANIEPCKCSCGANVSQLFLQHGSIINSIY